LKTHSFCKYDVQIDSTRPIDENVETVMAAWRLFEIATYQA